MCFGKISPSTKSTTYVVPRSNLGGDFIFSPSARSIWPKHTFHEIVIGCLHSHMKPNETDKTRESDHSTQKRRKRE